MIKLTAEEIEFIVTALNIRINIIETGNPVLSATDAHERGIRFNLLDDSQVQSISKMKALVNRLLANIRP